MVKSGDRLLNQWFKELRELEPNGVDLHRVTWLRVYGIHCHAYEFKLFELVSKLFRYYICVDNETSAQRKMGMIRILIRTRCSMVIN